MKLNKYTALIFFAFASANSATASTINCLVETQYSFSIGSTPFERGEVHRKAPQASKGYVGKMFNIDLELGKIGEHLVSKRVLKHRDGIFYQLFSDDKSDGLTVMNIGENLLEPNSKMTFTYTAPNLDVLSGYCQK